MEDVFYAGIVLIYICIWVSAPILARRRWGIWAALTVGAFEIGIARYSMWYIETHRPPVPPVPPAPPKTPQFYDPTPGMREIVDLFLFTAIPAVGALCGVVIALILSAIVQARHRHSQ
jgi:hypothetical protein